MNTLQKAEYLATQMRYLIDGKKAIEKEMRKAKRIIISLNIPTLKRWLAEKAAEEGRTPDAIFQRLKAGKYPNVTKIKIDSQTVLVVEK